MVRKEGLNINQIKGTGKNGRVVKEDVINHMNSLKNPSSQPSTT